MKTAAASEVRHLWLLFYGLVFLLWSLLIPARALGLQTIQVDDVLLQGGASSAHTIDDLSVTYALFNGAVTAGTAWYRNGVPELAAYLPMEGGGVCALLDCSGHGFATSAIGNPVWEATGGHNGFGAYTFDGDDMIDGGEHFPVNSSYTKAAWVYRTGDGQGDGNNIISGNEVPGGHAFWAPVFFGRKLSAGHDGEWNLVQDSAPLELNTWYFVAVTYDAVTDSMVLYKNGVEVDRDMTSVDVSDSTICIGSFGVENGYYWMGKIDDVRIYSHALSPQQVASLYVQGQDLLNASETQAGDVWQAAVTPFSGTEIGDPVCSNTVTIVMDQVPPEAGADGYTVSRGGTITAVAGGTPPGVLDNDHDGNGDTLTAALSMGPSHAASFELDEDGSFVYVHDNSATASDSFIYEVNDGNGGTAIAVAVIAIDLVDVAQDLPAFRVEQNYPNPFNPATAIRFELPRPAMVQLAIFTPDGRLVRGLLDEERPEGASEVLWNGCNDQGLPMPSGTYIYRLHAGSYHVTRKMSLLR